MGEADLDPKNKESIDAALSQDWERALKLNLELQKIGQAMYSPKEENKKENNVYKHC